MKVVNASHGGAGFFGATAGGVIKNVDGPMSPSSSSLDTPTKKASPHTTGAKPSPSSSTIRMSLIKPLLSHFNTH